MQSGHLSLLRRTRLVVKAEEPRHPTWTAVVASMGPLLVRRATAFRTSRLCFEECQSAAHRLLRGVPPGHDAGTGNVRLDVAGPVLDAFADTSVVDNCPLATEPSRQLVEGARKIMQCLELGRLHEVEANADTAVLSGSGRVMRQVRVCRMSVGSSNQRGRFRCGRWQSGCNRYFEAGTTARMRPSSEH